MTDRALLLVVWKTWPWVRSVYIDRALVAYRDAGRWQETMVPLGLDLTEANVTQLHAEGALTLVLAGLERGTSWEACYTPADLVRTLAPASCSG